MLFHRPHLTSLSVFRDKAAELRGFGSRNKSTAADLLAQFIHFLANEYDFEFNVGDSLLLAAEHAHLSAFTFALSWIK